MQNTLISELAACGVRLELRGDDGINAFGRLTPEQRKQISDNKPALVAALIAAEWDSYLAFDMAIGWREYWGTK